MSLITIHIYLIIIIIFIVICTVGLFSFFKHKKIQNCIIMFPSYQVMLETFMEKALAIIYKDRILIYSIEGTKPSDAEFKASTISFVNLVMKLLGPNLKNELIYLYGNEETLMFNLVEFFNTKTEVDDIKQTSLQNLMEKQEI